MPVLLGADNHKVPPCDRVADGDWFQSIKFSVEAFFPRLSSAGTGVWCTTKTSSGLMRRNGVVPSGWF